MGSILKDVRRNSSRKEMFTKTQTSLHALARAYDIDKDKDGQTESVVLSVCI